MLNGTLPGQLNAFERDALRVVADKGPCNGARIGEPLVQWYPDAESSGSVSSGRLYPALDRLEERGLIQVERPRHSRQNTYEITGEGEELVRVLEAGPVREVLVQ